MNYTELSRRDFLKLSATGICGLFLAGCGVKTPAVTEEYWQVNKESLMKDFNSIMNSARKFIGENTNSEETERIVNETKGNFEALLPQVPYIGGDDNQLTETLYMSAVALALYQSMKIHGKAVEETGRVMYRAMEELFNFNDPLMSAHTRNPTGKAMQESYRVIERWTEKSPFQGDWKMKFLEGDGVNFDFGVDYTECGIVKFYKSQNAFELTRYMCLGDFPISQGIGSGLVRTTTLGNGGPRCDFRFKAGRPIQMEWTPNFLK